MTPPSLFDQGPSRNPRKVTVTPKVAITPKVVFNLDPTERSRVIGEAKNHLRSLGQEDTNVITDGQIDGFINGCVVGSSTVEDVIGCVKSKLSSQIKKEENP